MGHEIILSACESMRTPGRIVPKAILRIVANDARRGMSALQYLDPVTCPTVRSRAEKSPSSNTQARRTAMQTGARKPTGLSPDARMVRPQRRKIEN